MAKKKKPVTSEQIGFEVALERLEKIVHDLERGDTGLSEALARYEEGVQLLQECHALLEATERRIEILSGRDAEGRPVTAPFDEEAADSLEEKAESRSRRRSRPTESDTTTKGRAKKSSSETSGLFE